MSQSFHLAQIQKIDTRIDQLNSRIHEIDQTLLKDQRLTSAELNLTTLEEILRKSSVQLKKIEQDVQTKRNKLEQSESNLYSGRVKIPKELQDLQNEVASLKKTIAGLEDLEIEEMIVVESNQKKVEEANAQLQVIQALVTSENASLQGEKSRLQNDLSKLLAERSAAESQITAQNLEVYSQLRKAKRGTAVAAINEDSCTACGTTLTPADRQAARSPNAIFYCPSCGRIIYGG